jgi:TPR repeat protein
MMVAAATGAAAGPYEDGVAASERGEHDKALKLLLPLADQGDPPAAYAVAELYAEGSAMDLVQAVKWYSIVADRLPAAETRMREKATVRQIVRSRQLTPPQLAEARRLVAEWQPTSATGRKP